MKIETYNQVSGWKKVDEQKGKTLIGYAVEYTKQTKKQVLESLEAGKEVKIGSDWWMTIRKEQPEVPYVFYKENSQIWDEEYERDY